MRHFLLATVLFAAVLSVRAGSPPVRTVAELKALRQESRREAPFELTVKVVLPYFPDLRTFFVQDDTGSIVLGLNPSVTGHLPRTAGEVLKIRGSFNLPPSPLSGFDCLHIDLIRKEAPIPPRIVSGKEFFRTTDASAHVQLRGTIRATAEDEIDPGYQILLLTADGETIYCSVYLGGTDPHAFQAFVGQDVEIEGRSGLASESGGRSHFGHILCVPYISYIRPLPNAQSTTNGIPVLDTIVFRKPSDLIDAGRYRTAGTVLAIWNRRSILLKTDAGKLHRADLIREPPPPLGSYVEAVGFPETDLYRLNLTCATWRSAEGRPLQEDLPSDMTVSRLFTNDAGQPQLHPSFHGTTLRLTGRLRRTADGRPILEADGHVLPLLTDICPSALSEIADGSLVQVTGICIMDSGEAAARTVLPGIHDVRFALRRNDDVVVIARPSWWTPGRLRVSVYILLGIVLGFAVLSEILRRLAERRGKALASEAVARAESDLKIVERTRLAVELHDAMSQTLTGIAYETDAAAKFAQTDPVQLNLHLSVAIRALHALRDELRNCLWDLRNNALELDDLDTAIRQTLEPHLGSATLAVRFNVPRDLLSDATAHALLRILRELTSNAVRHGHAAAVRIAGSIDGGCLVFSVRDDGCGFDPALAPGLREGHYGLQGIRERVAQLNGRFEITSERGKGTKAVVRIELPKELLT